MASTWSELGIRLMATGENSNAWGGQTNDNWNRLEDAADGFATVAVSGATSLTFTAQPTSYADENGRNKVLQFTGTAGGTQAITFPNIEKTYHVLNDSNSILTLTTGTGAATVSLAAGKDKMIYNDGSDEIHDALANLSTTTIATSGAATITGALTSGAGGTIGAAGTATSVAGIPFFSDVTNGSIYTHDVSGTDSTAEGNVAYGLQALDAITTGDYNTAIGYQALSAQSEGEGNIAVGQAALLANTTAGNNLAVGKASLLANTTGTRNVAIGNRTNDQADTENDNLAIGYQAMTGAVAGGEFNVAIGNYSLDALTSADKCVAIGYEAGSAITTGGANTLVGNETGKAITTGTFNTFFGFEAGVNFDTETHNLGIGASALGGAINGGEFNVAIGNYSLDALTSGDDNVAIGYNAGSANTSGGQNIYIGRDAGLLHTQDESNVIIGDDAVSEHAGGLGQSVVIGGAAGAGLGSGGSLVFIGYEAGANHDDESHNLGIGRQALGGAVAGGEFNVAVGNYALDAVTSGDNHTAIGYQAGSALTTTNNNTLIGHQAGLSATTCEDNVAIGMGAAANAVWTGDDNVVIGKHAGYAFTSAYNNVLVGKDAGLSISTGGGNVCIGKASGQDPGATPITTGTDNIFIGNGTNTQASDGVNAIGIGTNFTVAANNFSFGKQSNVVSNVFTSDANWARASDERLKTNITSVSWDSLDFINAIRPVTFTWKNSNAVPTDMDEYDADKNHMDTTTVIDGLIAQEVKTAMDAHNMTNFSGWKTSSLGTQTLSKEAFVIPLVKAVQELSATVTTLQQEINTLKGE